MPKVLQPEELVDNVDFCREYLAKNEKGEIQLSKAVVQDLTHRVKDAADNLFEVSTISIGLYNCYLQLLVPRLRSSQILCLGEVPRGTSLCLASLCCPHH